MNSSIKHAFTLIELLVVITIIVLLLSLLVPAMDKALKKAEILTCTGQLHTFGQIFGMYSSENKHKLPRTSLRGGRVYADTLWQQPNAAEIDLRDLEPYTKKINLETNLLDGDIWYCPSIEADMEMHNFIQGTSGPATGAPVQSMSYQYFAGVGAWKYWASHPQDMTDQRMGSDTLLMSDAFFRFINGGWTYNHSDDQPSVFDGTTYGGAYSLQNVAPRISGVNHLMADGSARWKDVTEFDNLELYNTPYPDRSIPRVQGDGDNQFYY